MKNIRSSLLLHSSSDLYGASKILLTTVIKLKESGEALQVVLSEEGPLAEAIRNEGVRVHIIRLGILRRKYFNISGLINRLTVLKKAYFQLLSLAKKENITHIYSNTSGVLIGAFVAKRLGVFHTWHLHEIITHPKWFIKLLGKIVNKYSDKVIVVSEAVKSNWQKFILPHKLELVYNGIDYAPYLEDRVTFREELSVENKLLIGMIGRINAWKGQSYFLDLAVLIRKRNPEVHFVMVGDVFPGDEDLESEMHQKILSLKLETHVTVLGFRKDISDIMSSLDLFILPSIQPDPLPTVILEAMASSLPVVATAHGGACEMVVDGDTGILIPWNNPVEAINKMAPILDNKELRLSYGRKGRERVLKVFSLDHYGQKMRKSFENANKLVNIV